MWYAQGDVLHKLRTIMSANDPLQRTLWNFAFAEKVPELYNWYDGIWNNYGLIQMSCSIYGTVTCLAVVGDSCKFSLRISRPRPVQPTLASRLNARIPVESAALVRVDALKLTCCDGGRSVPYSSIPDSCVMFDDPTRRARSYNTSIRRIHSFIYLPIKQ